MPLVRGGYPTVNPYQKLLAGLSNASQSDVPATSNLVWGFGNITDGALAASGVCAAVPVPVQQGATYTKVSVLVGGTAEATGTHAFAALYSGIATPALLQQSVDATGATAVGPVNATFAFTIPAVTVTPTNAPGDFLYVSISLTATTVATVASMATPAAINYQWTTSGPLFLSATHGSAVLGVAPATIATPAAKAVAPIVILT